MIRPHLPTGGTVLLTFVIIALQGCTLEPIIRPATPRGPITVNFKPAAGTSASAQIGDPMFATFNVMNVPFLRIRLGPPRGGSSGGSECRIRANRKTWQVSP